MKHVFFIFAAALLPFGAIACGDDSAPSDVGVDVGNDAGLDAGPDVQDVGVDVPVDAGFEGGPPCDGPPGLYIDPDCTIVGMGVRLYTPRYTLWSDGTQKERYVYLPPASVIDTRDPDNWVYPVGTRIWKSFLIDGLKIETRLFEKHRDGTGMSAWHLRTFAWNEDQDAVTEVFDGVVDALGTTHDIPTSTACQRCHAINSRVDVVNGFTAIQLNHSEAGVSLEALTTEGRLSDAIDLDAAQIPGDAVTSEALGYLHANCGNCHGDAIAPPPFGLLMWVRVGVDTPEATDTFATSVGVPSVRTFPEAPLRVAPADPDHSVLFLRMGARNALGDEVGLQMPPTASDQIDPVGLATVRAWIEALPAE